MANHLDGLEPTLLWQYFARICSIPHCSGREAALRDDLIGLARERGWGHQVDDVGNLVLSVPATPGHEGAPTVVLQGHLDMVCEKNSDTVHDFRTQGIEAYVDGDLVRARGTTLGSDNGIGVAAGLAVAADPDAVHGPLELLCTIEEETGLTGASGLDGAILRGRTLLNLDTEEEGALYVGCSGGGDQVGRFDLPRQAAAVGDEAVEIKVAGLLGGHSGLDIYLGRGNALIVLARLLDQAMERKLISAVQTYTGGNMHNAIPREARAVVRVPAGGLPALVQLTSERLEDERGDLGDADPGLRIEVRPTGGAGPVVAAADLERLVHLMLELPHGVTEMSEDIEGLVQTSNNIAVLEDTGAAFLLKTSTRSSIAANLEQLRDHICSAMEAAGGSIAEREQAYPGWAPNMASPVLARARRVHMETFGVEPEVKAIHAGLECGIIGESVPGMDMVSLGPTIMSPHSPDERISIPSVAQFYVFLVALLKDLASAPDRRHPACLDARGDTKGVTMMSVVPRTGRKSTELVALALPLAMTVMGIVAPARAGCDADRDCKGDRICVDERCVDPDADDRAAAPAISAKAVKRAEARLARARGFAVAGWIVGGLGVVGGGITIAAAIEDDWYSGPIGVSALVATAMFGAGIPLASAGGANARAGLEELRIEPLSPAARITGWVFYGVCLTTGIAAGALTLAEVDYVGYGLGGAAIATGIAGLTLMSIDGHVHAAMLAAALDELAVDTTHPTRMEPLVLLSPWFNLPDHDRGPVRAGIGITGRW